MGENSRDTALPEAGVFSARAFGRGSWTTATTIPTAIATTTTSPAVTARVLTITFVTVPRGHTRRGLPAQASLEPEPRRTDEHPHLNPLAFLPQLYGPSGPSSDRRRDTCCSVSLPGSCSSVSTSSFPSSAKLHRLLTCQRGLGAYFRHQVENVTVSLRRWVAVYWARAVCFRLGS